jgi:hypothetical protein
MEVIRNDQLPHSNNSLEFGGVDHPAGEPHGFTATGDGSKQINIHASPRFATEWLEQEAYG